MPSANHRFQVAGVDYVMREIWEKGMNGLPAHVQRSDTSWRKHHLIDALQPSHFPHENRLSSTSTTDNHYGRKIFIW